MGKERKTTKSTDKVHVVREVKTEIREEYEGKSEEYM